MTPVITDADGGSSRRATAGGAGSRTRRLPAGCGPRACEDVLGMVADGRPADVEPLGQRLGIGAARHEAQDLELATGERRGLIGRGRGRLDPLVDQAEELLCGRDVAEEVDGQRPAGPARRRLEDAHIEPYRSTCLGPRLHIEVLYRLAELDHVHDVAALIAEAVAVVVHAHEHLAAGPPKDLAGAPAQDLLGGSVPQEHTALGPDGENTVASAGERLLEPAPDRLGALPLRVLPCA